MMDSVEVTKVEVTNLYGAEYYGVNKRHILRGTCYSLTKPKVGIVCLASATC